MTGFSRRIPAAIAILFFGVAAFTTMAVGGTFSMAVGRGTVAALATLFFSLPLAYLIFDEDIPEPEAPEGLEHLAEGFRRDKKEAVEK